VLKYNDIQRTEDQFKNKIKDINILLMGDSHTRYAINPEYVNNSFNYASSSENYFMTYHKLLTIINNDKCNLSVLVLGIGIHSLLKSYEIFTKPMNANSWYWKEYIKINEHEVYVDDFNIHDKISQLIESYFPFIGQGSELIEFISLDEKKRIKKYNGNEIELIDGYKRTSEKFSERKNPNKLAIKAVEHQLNHSYDLFEFLFSYFLKIIDLAVDNDITVVLIKFPISQEYYDYAKSFVDVEEYYNEIYSEIYKYNQLYLLDYQKYFFGDNKNMRDSQHLNIYGAEIFSKMLYNDLMSLNVVI
jgi:hypothetical protein